MTLEGREIAFRIGAPGRHWVSNALGVIACAAALGADPEAAARALADFRAPAGRGRQHRLAVSGGAITLIDDSYNANPASVRAALDVLGSGDRAQARRARRHARARRPRARGCTRSSPQPIATAGIDRVYTAGPAMRHLHDALPSARRGAHVDDAAALLPVIEAELRPGDTLLVKGSLGMRMGRIVEALLTRPSRAPRRRAEEVGGAVQPALPARRPVRPVQPVPLPDLPHRRRGAHGADHQLRGRPVADPLAARAPGQRPADPQRRPRLAPRAQAGHADHGRHADPARADARHAALGRPDQRLRLGGAADHARLRRHRPGRRLPQGDTPLERRPAQPDEAARPGAGRVDGRVLDRRADPATRSPPGWRCRSSRTCWSRSGCCSSRSPRSS